MVKSTTAVVSGIVAVISLVVFIYTSHYTAVCNSAAGQVAQLFNSRAVNDCATASMAHGVSLGVMVVSGVLGVGCLVVHR